MSAVGMSLRSDMLANFNSSRPAQSQSTFQQMPARRVASKAVTRKRYGLCASIDSRSMQSADSAVDIMRCWHARAKPVEYKPYNQKVGFRPMITNDPSWSRRQLSKAQACALCRNSTNAATSGPSWTNQQPALWSSRK